MQTIRSAVHSFFTGRTGVKKLAKIFVLKTRLEFMHAELKVNLQPVFGDYI